jgi:hypothetical protein
LATAVRIAILFRHSGRAHRGMSVLSVLADGGMSMSVLSVLADGGMSMSVLSVLADGGMS